VGRLVGWSVGSLVGRLVGRSVGRLVSRRPVGWLVGRSVGRLVSRKCTVNRYQNFPLRACTVIHTGVYNTNYPLVTTRSIALSSDTIHVSI